MLAENYMSAEALVITAWQWVFIFGALAIVNWMAAFIGEYRPFNFIAASACSLVAMLWLAAATGFVS